MENITPKRVGRPKLEDTEKLNKSIQVMVTAATRRETKAAAKANGEKRADYLRRIIREPNNAILGKAAGKRLEELKVTPTGDEGT